MLSKDVGKLYVLRFAQKSSQAFELSSSVRLTKGSKPTNGDLRLLAGRLKQMLTYVLQVQEKDYPHQLGTKRKKIPMRLSVVTIWPDDVQS